jgi:2-oxoglutarate dehydrogenase complex dehydrogenase (E1) component-like enzyme
LENNLKKVYLANTGVEFAHITVLEEKEWVYENY